MTWFNIIRHINFIYYFQYYLDSKPCFRIFTLFIRLHLLWVCMGNKREYLKTYDQENQSCCALSDNLYYLRIHNFETSKTPKLYASFWNLYFYVSNLDFCLYSYLFHHQFVLQNTQYPNGLGLIDIAPIHKPR